MKAEPLGNWIKLAKGKKPEHLRSDSATGLLPYLDIAAIERGMKRQWAEASDGRVVPKGTLVMVWDGARSGWAGITPFDGLLGSTLVAVDSPLDRGYLAAFFRMHFEEINTNHRGTGIPHVNPDFLYSLSIPIPSEAQQRALAGLWEAIVSKKASAAGHLKSARAAVERLRHAVLSAACNGRLTASWREQHPATESAAAVLAQIDAERRRRLGRKHATPAPPDVHEEVPEGWCWTTIGALVNVATGATPLRSRADYYSGSIPWVTSGAVNAGTIREPTGYITELALQETNAKVFPSGTLLVALYGEGQTRGRVAELAIDAATNQALAGLLFDNLSRALRPYLRLFLLENYERIRQLSFGGVQPNLSLGALRETPLPLPPSAERDEIVRRANQLLAIGERLKSRTEAAAISLERTANAALAKSFRDEVSLNGSAGDSGDIAASVQLGPLPTSTRRRRERNS